MKKVVKLTLTKDNGGKFVVEFDNLKKIDEYINMLHTMRADLEHKLAMAEDSEEGVDEGEECDFPHCRFMSLVAQYLQMSQEDQKETSFAMLHALLDYLFVEHDDDDEEEEEDEVENEINTVHVKLKNGKEISVDCDDIEFNKKDGTLNYMLEGKTIYTIPLADIAD